MSLKELLGEELYNQVIEKAGDKKIAVVSDGNWIPKDKFDTLNTTKKDLEEQLEQRDAQLEDLKKVDADGLKQKIQDLQNENKTTKQEYQQKLDQQAFDFSLERALAGAKVKNAKAVKALLDTESIKLDGEKLLGLDDQLKSLKESDSYLFEQEEESNPKPSFTTGQHQTTGGGEPSNLQEALAQHYSTQNN